MSDLRLIASVTPVRKTSDNELLALRGMRDGSLVVVDFRQALIEEGRGYQIQLGTEDAPIASTTSIDDELVWALVDVPAGTTLLPLEAQAVVGTWTTSTLVNMLIEIDNAKVRYSSGGTAFTPLNLRSDNPRASLCTAVVGTDVAAAAKSAGGSLEVYRESIEVNVGDAADYWPKMEYKPRFSPVVVGPASVLFHFGAATADVTAYGSLKWVEVPTNSID